MQRRSSSVNPSTSSNSTAQAFLVQMEELFRCPPEKLCELKNKEGTLLFTIGPLPRKPLSQVCAQGGKLTPVS